MDLWKHKALVHGEAYSDEILLYILTEQNFELDQKVRSLEDATKENTAELKKLVNTIQYKITKTTAQVTAHKTKILWVGTSINDQHLQANKLEEKVDAKVDKLKAFTITRKEGRKNSNLNAEELIPKALDNKAYDLLVIEMGVNEISNLNISKEKHVLKEEINKQMEKLFHMALQYITDYPDLRVVLLQRLARLDSTDRASLSREADMAMTRMWEENGRPVNVILESLHLQVNSAEEKEDVFGRHRGNKGFGIHLRGVAGSKEFTYRAARLLLKVMGKGEDKNNTKEGEERRRKEVNMAGDSRSKENQRKYEEEKKKVEERKYEDKKEEEKKRRIAGLKKREEESKARIRDNMRKEAERKGKEDKRIAEMRRSDEMQRREDNERTRQLRQEVRRGEDRRTARPPAGRGVREGGARISNDYGDRKRAREARHREASNREAKMQGKGMREDKRKARREGRERDDYEERRRAREAKHQAEWRRREEAKGAGSTEERRKEGLRRGDEHMSSWREDPSSSQREEPRSSWREHHRTGRREEPQGSWREEYRSSRREEPRSSRREESRRSLREESRSSLREEPRSSWREEPRSSRREEPRGSWREEPRVSWREEPRSSQREELERFLPMQQFPSLPRPCRAGNGRRGVPAPRARA